MVLTDNRFGNQLGIVHLVKNTYKIKCPLIFKIGRYLRNGVNDHSVKIRDADPVHFRPDPAPDPANQNFKTGSRILLALKKSIQT